jgi:choline-glycine betaine transporter
MGSLSERGTLTPSRRTVIFWGVVMGAVAAVMLLVGGDEALTGLQNLTIIAALPFALVMVGLAVALARDVRSDPLVLRRTYAKEAVEQAVVEGITRHGDDFVLVVEAGDSEEGSGATRPVGTPGPGAGPPRPTAEE